MYGTIDNDVNSWSTLSFCASEVVRNFSICDCDSEKDHSREG